MITCEVGKRKSDAMLVLSGKVGNDMGYLQSSEETVRWRVVWELGELGRQNTYPR